MLLWRKLGKLTIVWPYSIICHVNPDGQTAEAFKEITRIYESRIPIARKDYDQELAKQLKTELETEISDRETKINSQQHRAWEFYRQGLNGSCWVA